MRFLTFVLAVMLFLGGASLAGKPGGGAVPPGTIYYSTGTVASPSTPIGCFTMNGDGSSKQATAFCHRPSRLLHGGRRWFLGVENVTGIYPNGIPRAELFATRDDGLKVQLTSDPNLEAWADEGQAWARDDSFASQPMVRWTPVSSAGNFIDGGGQRWLAEAAVYKAALNWASGSPVAAAPVAVLPAGLRFAAPNEYDQFMPRSDIWALDWAPSGAQLAYMRETGDFANGGPTTYDLYVASFDGGGNVTGTVHLGKGRWPEWAPNGGRIAFQNWNSGLAPNTVIWTISPSGSDLLQLTNTAQNNDGVPSWSPDSAYIAFHRVKYSTRGVPTSNVMRVPAGAGTPVDLTKDVADNAYIGGWR